jgi:hypothetical protein
MPGRLVPDRVDGVHVTQLFCFPSGAPGEMDDLTPEEQAALGVLSWFWENKGAFNTLHSQQPQTLAHAISDSPAGLLAWNAQLFDDTLDDDFVLTNVALYWLTGTAGSSIRFYYEDARTQQPPGRRRSQSRWPPQPTVTSNQSAASLTVTTPTSCPGMSCPT